MADSRRFQILSETEQHFFVPDCPLWVSRCRLSLDRETGRRLLQVRLVNRSGRQVSRIFLRVVCFDAAGSRLTQLEYVPLPPVPASARRIFGDGLVAELASRAAVRTEVFIQRVRFSDGGVWDEDPRQAVLGFAPPVPVRPEDGDSRAYRRAAEEKGLRSDFCFHSQTDVWTCICGVPNSGKEPVCACCGARRDWLERHMDPEKGTAPREPERQASPQEASPRLFTREPERQAPPQEPFPLLFAREDPAGSVSAAAPPPPVVQAFPPEWYAPADLRYRPPRPAAAPAPVRSEPEPQAQDRSGRTAALAVGAVMLLLLGILCSYHWLMPFLRYRRGVEAQASGSFATASAIFASLGDYQDSRARAAQNTARQGVALMKEQKYEQALALMEGVKGCESYAADCLYSLGVLACNEGDADKALDYASRLGALAPDDEKLPQLESCASYCKGNSLAAAAAEASDFAGQIELYRKALESFRMSDYADSEARSLECRYRIACIEMGLGQFLQAISDFSRLEGYKDSDSLIQTCKGAYVFENSPASDEMAMRFLIELAEAGDPKFQALLARFSGEGITVSLTYEDQENAPLRNLADLRLEYTVESGVPLRARCTLPDGQVLSSEVFNLLNPESGTVSWKELGFPAYCVTNGRIEIIIVDAELDYDVCTLTVQYMGGRWKHREE